MVLKSVEVLVTDRCNSKCVMCNMWNKRLCENELTPDQFKQLFSRPEFRELEDIDITGGEPLMRTDLNNVVDSIIENTPKLRMLFLSTNGTYPDRARDFFKRYYKKVKEVYLCVSLDGNRETNKKVRGIDSYESAIKTIEKCKEVTNGELNSIISMTLTPLNCDNESLEHIKDLAERTGSTFSFRIAWINDTYYQNLDKKLKLNESQIKIVTDFIENNCMEDPFMRAQLIYLKTGEMPIFGHTKSEIKCLAGDVFAVVRSDGSIFPCINSSRKIGDYDSGIFEKDIKDLGSQEQCPCCSECCFYPMLNFSRFSSKKECP